MLSIVVPVYNVEKYVEKCILSILKQRFTDYELILVDDGSTDDSKFLCDKYANIYEHIHVIHIKNGGVSVARNIGLEHAKGDYILFMDSDDYLCGEYDVELLYKEAVRTNADIVKGDFCFVSENGEKIRRSQRNIAFAYRNLSTDVFVRSVITYEFFLWSFIIKRSLIDEYRFVTNRIYLEDLEFICKLLLNASNVLYIPIEFYAYRQQPNSISSANDKRKIPCILDLIKVIYELSERKSNISLYLLYKSADLYIIALRMIALGGFYSKRKELSHEFNILYYREYVKKNIFSQRKVRKRLLCYLPPLMSISIIYYYNKVMSLFWYISYRLKCKLNNREVQQ